MAITSRELTIVTSANHVPGPKQGQWTYEYYAALPNDGQRYEIVDGVLYIAPSPTGPHQSAVMRIAFEIFARIELARLGRVFFAPYDVELTPGTVVQPDVFVLLNASLGKYTEKCVLGAPDLVVEVASPGTAPFDRQNKYAAYARCGVLEYWIADPVAHTVEVFILEGNTYHTLGIFKGKTPLRSNIVPGIAEVKAEQFFV